MSLADKRRTLLRDYRLAADEEPAIGAQVVTPRLGYRHYGIYAGNGRLPRRHHPNLAISRYPAVNTAMQLPAPSAPQWNDGTERFAVPRRRRQPIAPSSLSIGWKSPMPGFREEKEMRLLIATFLALAMGSAMADFSFRFEGGVVATGDSGAMVVRKAGRQPDRIVTIENRRGAAIGERWEYYLHDKQVNILMRGGRVTEIQDLR